MWLGMLSHHQTAIISIVGPAFGDAAEIMDCGWHEPMLNTSAKLMPHMALKSWCRPPPKCSSDCTVSFYYPHWTMPFLIMVIACAFVGQMPFKACISFFVVVVIDYLNCSFQTKGRYPSMLYAPAVPLFSDPPLQTPIKFWPPKAKAPFLLFFLNVSSFGRPTKGIDHGTAKSGNGCLPQNRLGALLTYPE